ncbi:MAG: argininosuccinate lyase [Anaerolineae bacterium]|nr:argininosuccinate lyase [Anaerolineae bacterium]
MTLWGGAFKQEPDDAVRALNDSLPYDWRLYDVDITGSQAWTQALAGAGILTPEEVTTLVAGLEAVRAEFAAGSFEPGPGDEDIHTAVERRLTEIIGSTAGKLHTGRSRNDQVATDFRLWLASAILPLTELVMQVQGAIVRKAAQHIESVMPGYTHLQPAQPVTAAHWLLSYAHMLERDRQRLTNARAEALASCPLGSGALAGTPYPVDRDKMATALGFAAPSANSLDAVSDRDYAAAFLFATSLLMTHLSRLAEDLILFSNPGFGFVTLDDRYSTGSSLMPQKRNPDPLELTRGKTGRIIGHLTGFLATLKGLPTGYNKDLQEDKEPIFDTVATLETLLPVLIGAIDTMVLHPARMRAALNDAMLATDLADYLVMKGVPFRAAHHLAGQVVRAAQEQGITLSALPLENYRAISPHFDEDTLASFDFDAAVARRAVVGGSAPQAVAVQFEALARSLGVTLD